MDLQIIKNNLEKEGFKVTVFENKEEASKYLNETIDNVSVGFGGSITLQELGIYELLKEHNEVYWHWRLEENETSSEVLKKAMSTDVYLSSVNAIAQTGEIINIDGSGNRISSMVFGHKKVYFVLGVNKIEENFEKAMYRAQNVAAPKNAKRLNKNTPCAIKADKCYNCNSNECICRSTSIINKVLKSAEYEVIIINEELGY